MSLVGLGDRGDFYAKAATGALGPGSYNVKLAKDLNPVRKRARSDRMHAFGSSAPKDLNVPTGNLYSPGPGFYN